MVNMRQIGLAIVLAAFVAAPAEAQEHGGSQGIPPEHLPPPGECRVWHDDVPPERQPPPTNCRQAEWEAQRNRDTRVVYGPDRDKTRETDRP